MPALWSGPGTDPILIFCLGFLIRILIIVAYPITWGGDTILRLYDPSDVLKAHKLPLLQVIIWGTSLVSSDPQVVRLVLAIVGAYAGLAFYWVSGDIFGKEFALPAGLLFISQPYLLAVSTVPFQEILMLATLLSAFHYFYINRTVAASIWLALACLTRYEAWLACPVLAFASGWENERRWRDVAKSLLLFGWAPVAWILARQGLTTTGHFVIEWPRSIERVYRFLYLGWVTLKFTQAPALVLAALGVWRLFRARSIGRRLWMQIALCSLFLVAVLFSAHGVRPDPERFVSSREAHIPMAFFLLLAVAGLPQRPRLSRALVALSFVLGITVAIQYVRLESNRPEVRLAYDVSQFLNHSLAPNEKALILAPPVDEGDARLYLDKAAQTGGAKGVQEARLELAKIASSPPDFQRVAVYSRIGRDRLLGPDHQCGDLVVVWDQYPEASRELEHAVPLRVFHAGGMSATAIRRQCFGAYAP